MCIFRPCVLVKLFVCIVVVNSTSPFTDDQHNPHSIASASSNRRARTWTQTATVQSADDGGSSDDEIAQQQLDNWETVVSHKHKTPAAQSFFRYKYADYAPSQRSNAHHTSQAPARPSWQRHQAPVLWPSSWALLLQGKPTSVRIPTRVRRTHDIHSATILGKT